TQPPKVQQMPLFQFPREDNARKVFIPFDVKQKLIAATAPEGLWARILLEFGFLFGWRRGSLLSLKREDVDLVENVILCRISKNSEPLEAALDMNLKALVQAHLLTVEPGEKLFPVQDWRYVWHRICERAGVKP